MHSAMFCYCDGERTIALLCHSALSWAQSQFYIGSWIRMIFE